MVLSWFDAREARAFGAALASFCITKIPANQKIGDKKFALKTQKTLGQMTDQVVRFKSQNRLNTYKKAQLGNAFKWTLREEGYDPEQIDQLTKWLMLQLT